MKTKSKKEFVKNTTTSQANIFQQNCRRQSGADCLRKKDSMEAVGRTLLRAYYEEIMRKSSEIIAFANGEEFDRAGEKYAFFLNLEQQLGAVSITLVKMFGDCENWPSRIKVQHKLCNDIVAKVKIYLKPLLKK